MSTIPILLRTTRTLLDGHTINLRNSSLNKYPTYSSFRNIWSNLTRRKEATAEQQKTEGSSAAGEEGSAPESTADPKLRAQLIELNAEIEEFKKKNSELNDKYMRALAENENIRKRLLKQIEEAKLYGIQGFCKDLLDVADVLNKATECVPKEEVTDTNPHLKNLYEGLTMTETVLKSVFTRHGLTPVNPINEKFDPNYHEALFEQAVEGKPAGTVVVVSKHGYKLHERVIRPALVGVSK